MISTVSPSMVSRMEAGQRGASARDVRDLCGLYGVTDQSVVLDEAVLHRTVGGVAAMRVQLDNIIKVTKNYDVTVRVIPYGAGAHPAMESKFSILDFQDAVPSVVYVEGVIGSTSSK